MLKGDHKVNDLINELTEFCKTCTPEEAMQIEDNIRVMLMHLVPKSNRALGLKAPTTMNFKEG